MMPPTHGPNGPTRVRFIDWLFSASYLECGRFVCEHLQRPPRWGVFVLVMMTRHLEFLVSVLGKALVVWKLFLF